MTLIAATSGSNAFLGISSRHFGKTADVGVHTTFATTHARAIGKFEFETTKTTSYEASKFGGSCVCRITGPPSESTGPIPGAWGLSSGLSVFRGPPGPRSIEFLAESGGDTSLNPVFAIQYPHTILDPDWGTADTPLWVLGAGIDLP